MEIITLFVNLYLVYTYLPQYMLMISNEGIYINVCISLSTIFKEEVMKVYFNAKK